MNAPFRFNEAVALERFQSRLVSVLIERLRRSTRPLLLRSPTGSGKTLMLGRTLDGVAAHLPTLWFWFVPYVNLVSQTVETLREQCTSLQVAPLSTGIRFDHAGGDVLVGTAISVSSATQRRDILDPRDEAMPGLFDAVARARAAGLNIGVVVDEAHIGLSTETEFGRFCRRLAPDRIVMATATPRDSKLNEFLAAAEYADFEAFTVSRDEVVDAFLNKKYVAAVVFRLSEEWQTLADLRLTVLRRACEQRARLEEQVDVLELTLRPMLLVQVENGAQAIAQAKDMLVKDCGISPEWIGSYEGSDNNTGGLQRIAHDPRYRILIFKEAAGTGFDVPRAFILASMKPVSDMDFASQFIGRIMRVAAPIRQRLRDKPLDIPPDLETGFIFLANAASQAGFEGAVRSLQNMKANLDGVIEALTERRLADGTTLYTNRPTAQPRLGLPLPLARASRPVEMPSKASAPAMGAVSKSLLDFIQVDDDDSQVKRRRAPSRVIRSGLDLNSLLESLSNAGIASFPRRTDFATLPAALKSERRPNVTETKLVVQAVVRKLEWQPGEVGRAAQTAYGAIRGTQVTTDLITLAATETETRIEIDRLRLAAEVQGWLSALPQASEADADAVIKGVAQRIRSEVARWLDDVVPGEHRNPERDQRTFRDSTYLLLRANRHRLTEVFNSEMSAIVEVYEAGPLPDLLVFSADIPLTRSRKNIYGIQPPMHSDIERSYAHVTSSEWLAMKSVTVTDRPLFKIEQFDSGWALNGPEKSFVERLDAADFVVWWHRNPDRKPYSTSVVRTDSNHRFYPDFVVCIGFWEGDEPTIRLLETKYDPIDAERKSRRDPLTYGRVIFLRSDQQQQRMFLINADGTSGDEVDRDLHVLRDALRRTA